MVADEGSFPFVSFFDVYVVVTPLKINLCEILGALEFVDELGDDGEQIVAPYGMFV